MFSKVFDKGRNVTAVTILCALLVACSAATIISYIDEALQIAVEAGQITGVIPPQFAGYVSASLGCIDFAATEVASADTPADQYAKVFAQCGSLVKVNLPGLPQNLVDFATRLATKIAQILTNLKTPSLKAVSANKPPKPMVFSAEQRNHLHDISVSAKLAKAALNKRVALQAPTADGKK